MANAFAILGLGESYESGVKTPFWKDIQDNLKELRKQLTEDVLSRQVSVDMAAGAAQVIDAVFMMPEVAAQRVESARATIKQAEAEGFDLRQLEFVTNEDPSPSGVVIGGEEFPTGPVSGPDEDGLNE